MPVDETQFLKIGDIVQAKDTVYDLPPDKSWIHAEKNDKGHVVHTEPGYWPTVRFFKTGTATCVTPDEVELI